MDVYTFFNKAYYLYLMKILLKLYIYFYFNIIFITHSLEHTENEVEAVFNALKNCSNLYNNLQEVIFRIYLESEKAEAETKRVFGEYDTDESRWQFKFK